MVYPVSRIIDRISRMEDAGHIGDIEKVRWTILLIMVMMAVSVSAIDVSMKSSDQYIAQYQVTGTAGELSNCIPEFTGTLANQPWAIVQPGVFRISEGVTEELLIGFQEPPAGYYQGSLQVKCLQYQDGQLIGAVDLLSSPPDFNVLVKQVGQGESYSIVPSNSYIFISNAGQAENAQFQIANTGTDALEINVGIPTQYAQYITILPSRAIVDRDEIMTFKITVNVPQDFSTLESEVPIQIGDFEDTFFISGSVESLAQSGAPLQSIAFGNVKVGAIEIPVWILLTLLIIAGYLLFKKQ